RVLRCWMVAMVAAGLLLLVSRVTVTLPGVAEPFHAWPGFWMLVASVSLLTGAVLAADGASRMVRQISFGWRQPVAGFILLAALMAPIAGMVWWLSSGTAGPLARGPVSRVP